MEQELLDPGVAGVIGELTNRDRQRQFCDAGFWHGGFR